MDAPQKTTDPVRIHGGRVGRIRCQPGRISNANRARHGQNCRENKRHDERATDSRSRGKRRDAEGRNADTEELRYLTDAHGQTAPTPGEPAHDDTTTGRVRARRRHATQQEEEAEADIVSSEDGTEGGERSQYETARCAPFIKAG